MPCLFNNGEPKTIYFNDSPVKQVVFNGVVVWPSAKDITLSTAVSSSTFTLRPDAYATTSSGTLTANNPFIVVSSTATNGRIPIICNGNNGFGMYWISNLSRTIKTTVTVKTNNMIVFLSNTNNTTKTIYKDKTESSSVLAAVKDWPIFVAHEKEPKDGFYHVRHGEIDGYVTTNYMSDVIDLSTMDLSAWTE